MYKFEKIGSNLQLESSSIPEANVNFKHSCNICCTIGLQIDCNRCIISASHDNVVAALRDVAEIKLVHHDCCGKGCDTLPEFDTNKCDDFRSQNMKE